MQQSLFYIEKVPKLCNKNLSKLQNLRGNAQFLLQLSRNNIIIVAETKTQHDATNIGGIS